MIQPEHTTGSPGMQEREMEPSYKGQGLPGKVEFKLRRAVVSHRENGANTFQAEGIPQAKTLRFEVTGEDMWQSLVGPQTGQNAHYSPYPRFRHKETASDEMSKHVNCSRSCHCKVVGDGVESIKSCHITPSFCCPSAEAGGIGKVQIMQQLVKFGGHF